MFRYSLFPRSAMPRTRAAKSQRRRPSQARAYKSVAVILEASAQVLAHTGYERATTNRIAERAGVSVGTLYQYFRNKDEIFDALIEQESRRYLQAIADAMPEPKTPLRRAIRTLLEAGYAHQHMVTGITQVMRHAPSTVYARRSREIRAKVHALIVSFLASRGPMAGLDDLELAADVILAQCEGLTFLGRVPRTPEQQIAILVDVLGRYLESFQKSGRRSSGLGQR
jgi:AcrR family transcriptional regulator